MSVTKKIQPLCSLTSGIIKSIRLLPDDIQNILILKQIAMEKQPKVDVHLQSNHLASILGYLSNISDTIYNRELSCSLCSSYNTALENPSLIINPDELDRMEELKIRAVVKNLYDRQSCRTRVGDLRLESTRVGNFAT